MSAIGLVLAGIGGIAVMVFGVILLVKAFQTSVLWGLGYIFVPFVSLVFVVMHWQETKKPFLPAGGLGSHGGRARARNACGRVGTAIAICCRASDHEPPALRLLLRSFSYATRQAARRRGV